MGSNIHVFGLRTRALGRFYASMQVWYCNKGRISSTRFEPSLFKHLYFNLVKTTQHIQIKYLLDQTFFIGSKHACLTNFQIAEY